jgi:hypothetical protein
MGVGVVGMAIAAVGIGVGVSISNGIRSGLRNIEEESSNF